MTLCFEVALRAQGSSARTPPFPGAFGPGGVNEGGGESPRLACGLGMSFHLACGRGGLGARGAADDICSLPTSSYCHFWL